MKSFIKKIHSDITSPIIIIGALFFVFGFITWISAVLVPYLKIACELNNFQLYLVAFSFYIAYFFMSVPSGWLLEYTGYKKGMTIGLSGMFIALLGLANSGAAIIPLLYGRLADLFTARAAYWIVLPIYFYILFYALKGHKIRLK
ncbi:MAG: hypothetical protein A2X05_02825 [Bacteroidetes bacterium GWE2_41_25]|nr:MAG: hypothetical protein A2X03_09555 [Bacteroidetes bacterium GWA2_40_15]OFX92890.1 MAG: hypothetical protein A2X06_15845 [Bacteroidetes bacterium GWC2_40_22]OFY03825.1 MAG: hypothetical protein A2X05_02825 [Bacteroidetes bacterium GWE2_41_25]OFY59379.1 MAG: hypothetical protein A2X04_15465 [Bacteroidetes bacterium GWF2_41_9]